MEDKRKEIFAEIKKILLPYGKKMNLSVDNQNKIELLGKKKATIYNKEIDGMYFAWAMIQKNFVGFYCFFQYSHPGFLKGCPENPRKCLKGKSCFHIKKNDPELMKSIKIYVDKGYKFYRKLGII
jgi:hypothetical protein